MDDRKPLPVEYSSLVPPLPADIQKMTANVFPINQPSGVYDVGASADVEMRFQLPTRLGFYRPHNVRLQFVVTNTSTTGAGATPVKTMGHHFISGLRVSQGVNVLREWNYCPEGYTILWDMTKANYINSEGSIMAGQSAPWVVQMDATDPGYLAANGSRDFALLLPGTLLSYSEQLVPMPLLNAPIDIVVRLNTAGRALSPTAGNTTLGCRISSAVLVLETLLFAPTWVSALQSATRVAPLRFFSKEVIFFSDALPDIANGEQRQVQIVIPVRAPLVALQHAFFKRGSNTAANSQNVRTTYQCGLRSYVYQLGTVRYPTDPVECGGIYAPRALYHARLAAGVGNDVVRSTTSSTAALWGRDTGFAAGTRPSFQFGMDFSVVASESRKVLGNSFPANRVADQLTVAMWFQPSATQPLASMVMVTAATVETMYEVRGDGSMVRVV